MLMTLGCVFMASKVVQSSDQMVISSFEDFGIIYESE